MPLSQLFIHSQVVDWAISIGLLILFSASTASAVQNIKAMAEQNDPKLNDRLVIVGAAALFTNFMLLFVRILQAFGKRKN